MAVVKFFKKPTNNKPNTATPIKVGAPQFETPSKHGNWNRARGKSGFQGKAQRYTAKTDMPRRHGKPETEEAATVTNERKRGNGPKAKDEEKDSHEAQAQGGAEVSEEEDNQAEEESDAEGLAVVKPRKRRKRQ